MWWASSNVEPYSARNGKHKLMMSGVLLCSAMHFGFVLLSQMTLVGMKMPKKRQPNQNCEETLCRRPWHYTLSGCLLLLSVCVHKVNKSNKP